MFTQVRRGKSRMRNLEAAGRFLETSGEVLATLEQVGYLLLLLLLLLHLHLCLGDSVTQ